MAPLMVLMKENLKVPCLDLSLEKKLLIHLVLWMVLMEGYALGSPDGFFGASNDVKTEGSFLGSSFGDEVGNALGSPDGADEGN